MIVDTLKNIGSYAALNKNFATAAAFLATTDLTALPMGRTVVDGDNVYATLQRNDMPPKDVPVWEAHAKYADIQVILEGREKFGYGLKSTPDPIPEGTDLCFCHDVEGFFYDLTEGQFTIFLPWEAHSPCNPVGDQPESCLKLVVKVLVNP